MLWELHGAVMSLAQTVLLCRQPARRSKIVLALALVVVWGEKPLKFIVHRMRSNTLFCYSVRCMKFLHAKKWGIEIMSKCYFWVTYLIKNITVREYKCYESTLESTLKVPLSCRGVLLKNGMLYRKISFKVTVLCYFSNIWSILYLYRNASLSSRERADIPSMIQ